MLTSPPTWFLLGFEFVTFAAAVFGVLLGLGKFPSAPGLALLCVAGAIAASAFLGYLGAAKELMGVKLGPFMLGRWAAAGGIAVAAGIAVVMRHPRASLSKLASGGACAAGLAACGAAIWFLGGAMSKLAPTVQAIAGLIAFVVLLGLLAASVHLFIAAFESCDVENLPERDGA
ncbi:MAG: hypothetical protein IT438_13710 [Phycisphaerales bacterium]|nr:hypothetical protein [Phycisphaerales bacterium]